MAKYGPSDGEMYSCCGCVCMTLLLVGAVVGCVATIVVRRLL